MHSPIAPAPELAKVLTHEAVAAYLATRDRRPSILCGDLNTPRRELADGDVLTFAQDSAGRLRPERGERWDRAERALVHGLRERAGSTPSAPARLRRARGELDVRPRPGGWRLDHVLVDGLRPWRARTPTMAPRRASATTRPLVVDLVR